MLVDQQPTIPRPYGFLDVSYDFDVLLIRLAVEDVMEIVGSCAVGGGGLGGVKKSWVLLRFLPL